MVEFDQNFNPIPDPREPQGGPQQQPQPQQPMQPPVQPAQHNQFTPPPVPPRPPVTPSMPPTPPTPPTPTVVVPPAPREISKSPLNPIMALAVLAIIVLTGILGVMAWNGSSRPNPNGQPEGINVSAEGISYVDPEIAEMTFGVQKQGSSVADVEKQLKDNTRSIKSVLSAFKIEDKDIKTTEFNISPRFDGQPTPAQPTGYDGRHSLMVKVRDLSKIDAVSQAIVAAGANNIQNIWFTVDDPDKFAQQAREDAVKKAKEKAEAIAKAGGVKLGRLVSINEYVSGPIFFGRGEGLGGDMKSISSIPMPTTDITTGDIQPGNMEIRVSVNMTYKIR